MYVCMYVYICIYIYREREVCIYICMYVCIYTLDAYIHSRYNIYTHRYNKYIL
jgi:hypothetical protein